MPEKDSIGLASVMFYFCKLTALAADADGLLARVILSLLVLVDVALVAVGKYSGPLKPQAVRNKAVSKKANRERIVAWLSVVEWLF
ncbi:hypothetical protein [Deefgea piscis]|uniref:hypothetical protein n=1 Tax=Deefgea piscis TaxID=2739061 RepID=UPI0020C537B1|nr:hypothetical protein [Deefgea piscis]